MKKQFAKRLLAMIMCIMMVAGVFPTTALATTSDPIYVLAGGDYQQAGDHANSAENVANILAQISQKYTTMDGFLFIGDYDCETHNDATETANGIASLMDTVDNTYSTLNHENSILAQGNHDYLDSNIDATGGHDFTGYSTYVLNEDDYPNGGGTQSGIQTLADNLKTWLNNKLGEGYDAPIFIVSHLPLAFSPRTVTQGDAKYASLIFDVLNTAADNGLNIIFLHGHDHAYGPDNYMGGEAIYLAEGDKIAIAETGSTSEYTWETLNFTYMNAGYTGYYSDPYTYVTDAGTDKLTMTVFKIENNQVTVERYSANGSYNVKSEGYDGSYSDTSVTNQTLKLGVNSTVYASPQTISLGTVETYGTIGEYVGVTGEITDDVTTSGNDWTTIVEPVAGTTTYTYTQVNSIEAGKDYVIVGNSNDVALMDNDGSMESQSVTISGTAMTSTTKLTEWTFSSTSSGTINNGTRYLRYNNSLFGLSTNSSNLSITANASESNFRIYSKRRSFYYNGSSWTHSDRDDPQYVRLYQLTGSATEGGSNGLYARLDGELTYNVANGTSAKKALVAVKEGIAIKYATAADYSDEAEYADDGEGMTWTLDSNYDGTTPGDYAVTISYNGTVIGTAEVVVPATTTYYIAEGNGMYYVDMNTSADDALAVVKAGVTVSSATDANGTNKTTISDDDVTWKWVDTYNGADSGPYTVEILYNGTSLGTVEVKVNVKYETGIADGWTYIGTSEGDTYIYTLDTDGIDYGSDNKYIIVARDASYALDADSTADGTAQSITIDGNDAMTTTRDYEYYFTTAGLITKDGSNTLYQQDWGIKYGYVSGAILNGFTNLGNGYYRLYDTDGTARSLYYDGYSFIVTSSDHTNTNYSVRLYKYTGSTGGGETHAKLEGSTVYTVEQGTTATEALSKVKEGITGYITSNSDGSDATELVDSALAWKWKNTYTGTITGSYRVEISYNGVVLGTVEVRVEPGVINNYPEYPDEGAVKVNKTGTGIDFQSSGIAQVEISASGIPLKKGIDVIIMVDTSSSMKTWCICGTQNCTSTGSGHARRNVIFEESLEGLVAQLQAKNDDGTEKDIRVALADFNGFNGYNDNASYGTPYDREENDTTNDTNWYSAVNQAKVYTGNGELSAGAFVQASKLSTDSSTYGFNYVSGTNYDYAFDAIYQLGHSIKEANTANGEDRDLYVVFMSDGAPMQYNYYHSQGASSNWQYWLTGTVEDNGGFSTVVRCQDHTYYYDGSNGNKHRMAEAVKGSVNSKYEVIRKATTGLEDVLVATDETNMYTLPGLGATMFSIAFDPVADGNTPASAMTHVLENIATEQTESTQYYYLADSATDLSNAFTSIGNAIAYAANNARFVDQMGDNYNLQMKTSTYSVVDGTSTITKTLAPVIEIITYDIYTRQDYLNGTITEDKIGDRKGTYTLQEVVKFSDDGTKAYSNLIDVDKDGTYGVTVNSDGTYTISDTDDNIIGTDGIIYAKTFLYNTTALDVTVTGIDIPTGTNSDDTTTGKTSVLPSETFYWKLGTIQTAELAMRYYVYLDGSMEGTREAGSYPTNEFATLYYDNYLGNPCYKETVSPDMAWKEANVSYAFYLVNENGDIIVNQTTGQTGSFANKIAVTKPVVYETVLLNSDEEVSSIDIASLGVLPEGYTLYDYDGTNGATYTVTINSNTTGEWDITSVKDKATTYVMQYDSNDASAYTNEKKFSEVGYDYTHTVVWFAVLWKRQALPDAVVIDYGLPVDISVLANDMFGENGKLAGVGAYSDSVNLDGHDADLADGFASSYKGTYGTAKSNTETGKVRYTPSDMEMNGYDKFAYAVNYTGNENAGYYYDTVTVIPATTIYYEDNFLIYSGSGTEWVDEGTAIEDATQSEDRPGAYSLTDANNIYGYDGTNLGMSTFSLGSAKKVHVDANSYATASFTFYGTGFDVIGMTSNTTGTIAVKVTAAEDIVVNGTTEYAEGTKVKSAMVNTYYGYKSEEHEILYTYTGGEWIYEDKGVKTENTVVTTKPEEPKEGDTYTATKQVWVATPDTDNALYQVPVMQIEELPYGKYNVTITATYAKALDKTTADGYDLYLDAIRIYDPANDGLADGSNDTTIENAYKADGEGWPSYIELRNQLISSETLGNTATSTPVTGLVFIDGDAEVGDAQISDYVSYGPNNEVYIAPGQRVAFMLDTPDNIANIHIGIKSADGNNGTYTITNIAQKEDTKNNVAAGQYYNARTYTISTTTDMYYDLSDWKNDIIVISNTGDRYNTTGIISLTNIKSTYTSDPNEVATTSLDDEDSISTASTDTEVSNNETYVYMTAAAATLTLRSLNTPTVEETPDVDVPEEDNTGSNDSETNTSKPEDDTTESGGDVSEEEKTEQDTQEPSTEDITKPEQNPNEDNKTEENKPTVDSKPEENNPTIEEGTSDEGKKKETFKPKRFKVKLSKSKIRVGSKYKVVITTSKDVRSVKVNGKKYTKCKYNRKKGIKTWTITLKGKKVGKRKVSVIAYNKKKVASKKITKTIRVLAKKKNAKSIKAIRGGK